MAPPIIAPTFVFLAMVGEVVGVVVDFVLDAVKVEE